MIDERNYSNNNTTTLSLAFVYILCYSRFVSLICYMYDECVWACAHVCLKHMFDCVMFVYALRLRAFRIAYVWMKTVLMTQKNNTNDPIVHIGSAAWEHGAKTKNWVGEIAFKQKCVMNWKHFVWWTWLWSCAQEHLKLRNCVHLSLFDRSTANKSNSVFFHFRRREIRTTFSRLVYILCNCVVVFYNYYWLPCAFCN